MQNDNSQTVSAESLARRHEARDPNLRNVLISVVSIVLMMVFCLLYSGVLMHWFAHQRTMQDLKPLGIVSAPDMKPFARFPPPNLDVDDNHAQMTALRERQLSELNSYGWADRSSGVARIPIERAMDLILQNGLPARTNGVSQTDGSTLQLIQKTGEER